MHTCVKNEVGCVCIPVPGTLSYIIMRPVFEQESNRQTDLIASLNFAIDMFYFNGEIGQCWYVIKPPPYYCK